MSTSFGGQTFGSSAHAAMSTAAEIDVLVGVPHSARRAGAIDIRLKTLIDGLPRPANARQLKYQNMSMKGDVIYCRMHDDSLLQRGQLNR
jgi:hypothetical protein